MSEPAEILAGNGRFESLPAEQPFPGVTRQAFTTSRATVSRYDFEPGATFPLHSHPQEQITLVARGSVEMTIAGETETLTPGAWSVAPSGVEHGITAGPEGASFVAILSPPRSRSDEYEISGNGS